jgi:hypothetical protein
MIPDDKGWHLTPAQVSDYAGERATMAQAASVETHLTACGRCRSMLDPVLPDLPMDRMWQQIVLTVDGAPTGRFRRAVRWLGALRPSATFRAAALRPRLIVITGIAVLVLLTLAIQPRNVVQEKQGVRAVAASQRPPQPSVTTPDRPSALQVSGMTSGIPHPRPAAPPARRDGPAIHVPSPMRLAVPPEPRRDRIPWRTGRHPR